MIRVAPWASVIFLLLAMQSAVCAETRTRLHDKQSPPSDAPIVRNIDIQVTDVFEGENLQSFYSAVNSVKINTRKEILKRELLFKEGEAYQPFLIQESERVLRALRYVRNVKITPTFDANFVDLKVSVQDTWTLIPYLSFSFGSGSTDHTAVGLTESNLLGYGKRAELLYRDEDGRESIETVWEDQRVWGTKNALLLGYFDRSDGYDFVGFTGLPYRSLEDPHSFGVQTRMLDNVGKLFGAGDERFIYGQDKLDLETYYSFATGDPDSLLHRYTFGYQFSDYAFREATLEDFENVDIDPSEVLNDPSLIPNDRKFSYPYFSYNRIVPDFVSHSYVDRFDRVQDFNLGNVLQSKIGYASESFGSDEDAWFFSVNDSDGFRLSGRSFVRGEIGAAGRYEDSELVNSLIRGEAKYVYLAGPRFIGTQFIGNHTFVASSYLNYGDNLDGEREFYSGASDGLRGYDSRTFFGDKSFYLGIEDRFHLVDDILKLVSLGGAFFAEVGGATDESLSTLLQDELYGDFGVGLRFGFPRSSGGRVLRVDLAFPFRDGPDGTEGMELRFVVEGGQVFEAVLESEKYGADKVNVDTGFED